MTGQDRVWELLTAALDNFDRPGMTVAALVRQAARIASLRHDYAAQYRLQLELIDHSTGSQGRMGPLVPIQAQLVTLLGREEAQAVIASQVEVWQHNRKLSAADQFNSYSIAQIEHHLGELKSIYGGYSVPANLSTGGAYRMAIEVDKQKAILVPLIQEVIAIVERVRQSVHDFMIATETELHSGKATGGVFNRGLEYVRQRLATRSPSALAKFAAAEERLLAGGPEDLSHALTSVRRMFKDLADALYPATGDVIVGEDSVERVMDDDAYRNRLIQFVKDRLGKHAQADIVSETLRSVGTRLNKLDSLASKGVHGDVGVAEAEACVVWTFMLAADLLRIDDGTARL